MAHPPSGLPDPEPLFKTLNDCREAIAKALKNKWVPQINEKVFKGVWPRGKTRRYRWSCYEKSIVLEEIVSDGKGLHHRFDTIVYIGVKERYYEKSISEEAFPFLWANFVSDPTWLKYFNIKVSKNWLGAESIYISAKETLLQGRHVGSLDDHLGNVTTQEMTRELLDDVLKKAENLSLEQMLTSEIQEVRQLGLFFEKKKSL